MGVHDQAAASYLWGKEHIRVTLISLALNKLNVTSQNAKQLSVRTIINRDAEGRA